MENLAGNQDCDKFIQSELIEAEIGMSYLDKPVDCEVPYSVYGRMGDFVFTRAWYYWVVKGKVPIEVACEIYAEWGREIRHSGHCACPPPDKWVKHGGTVDSPFDYIDIYHIDTQRGLNRFIKILKKHLLL